MVTASRYTVEIKPLVQTIVPPVETRLTNDGTLFADFGKAAFGTVLVPSSNDPQCGPIVVHLGEKLALDGRIDRNPPGSVRYIRIEQALEQGPGLTRITIPPDKRNTGPGAVKMPVEIGKVYPFRYAEIERAIGIDPSAVRQVRVHYPFDDSASSFDSSDTVLNAVWDLCKYSIKATTLTSCPRTVDSRSFPLSSRAVWPAVCMVPSSSWRLCTGMEKAGMRSSC